MEIFQKHEKSSPNGGAHQTVNRHSGMEQHPLPLPMGEVAERSEDGEGEKGCKTLSVTYGDSSPGGRAKVLHVLAQEIERICTDTLYSLLYDCPIKTGLSCGKITP